MRLCRSHALHWSPHARRPRSTSRRPSGSTVERGHGCSWRNTWTLALDGAFVSNGRGVPSRASSGAGWRRTSDEAHQTGHARADLWSVRDRRTPRRQDRRRAHLDAGPPSPADPAAGSGIRGGGRDEERRWQEEVVPRRGGQRKSPPSPLSHPAAVLSDRLCGVNAGHASASASVPRCRGARRARHAGCRVDPGRQPDKLSTNPAVPSVASSARSEGASWLGKQTSITTA